MSEPVPTKVRAAVVGYREYDGGPVTLRVDLIDTEAAEALASITPEDARSLAGQLVTMAGRARIEAQ